jgi:hypothetical protein
LSYEDHPSEVTRRTQAIVKRLNLKLEPNKTKYWNLQDGGPIAIVTENGVEPKEFAKTLISYLKAIPGHKFVTIDSIYNCFEFRGNAKINEGSVKKALEFLNQICRDTDSTILGLFHPSQAGQDRGDASGWSVAWHNTPRARLSIAEVKDKIDTFLLKTEKRNNGPKPPPIELHWSDGILAIDNDANDTSVDDAPENKLKEIIELIDPILTEIRRTTLTTVMTGELNMKKTKAQNLIRDLIPSDKFIECSTENGLRWLKRNMVKGKNGDEIIIEIRHFNPEPQVNPELRAAIPPWGRS